MEGQLVLCYRFLSKTIQSKIIIKVTYQGQLTIIKVKSINSYQLLLDIKVTAAMVLKYREFTCPSNRKLIHV